MGTFTIRKTKAARTRIRGCKGHYMGLKMGLFFKMQGFAGLFLRRRWERGFVRLPGGTFTGIPGTRFDYFLLLVTAVPDFFKNVQRGYRTFQKMFINVIDLSGK
jgi:hypothetical protein